MTSDAQLVAIRDISTAFSRAGIEHWLAGGWAVEFLCGSVSRPHKDVDLVSRGEDAETAAGALAAAGFERIESAFPDERLEHSRDGVDVEVILVIRDATGRLVTPGRWIDWPWPPDTLSGPMGTIRGVSCRVVSVAAQIDSKRNYEARRRRPPRNHDVHDLKLLEAFGGDA